MQNTKQRMKCPKCSSTEFYGTHMVKEYFTLDEEGNVDDKFERSVCQTVHFHCYKCKHTWRGRH